MAVSLNDNLLTGILDGNQNNSLATILDSIEDTENEIKVNNNLRIRIMQI